MAPDSVFHMSEVGKMLNKVNNGFNLWPIYMNVGKGKKYHKSISIYNSPCVLHINQKCSANHPDSGHKGKESKSIKRKK